MALYQNTLSPLAPAGASRPSPLEGEDFAGSALRLAGLAGALLGWRPDEFWGATPAELAVVFDALNPPGAAPAGGDVLTRLQEQYPDG